MKIRSTMKILLLSLVVLQHLVSGEGHRILAAFFFPARSHFMMANSIVRELVKRGHEVTFITPFSLSHENLGPNYKEIEIDQYQSWAIMKELTNTNTILEMADLNKLTFLRMVNIKGIQCTDFVLRQPQIQELIHAKEKVGKYDLLLAEQFYTEGALMLGHLYQIPVITAMTYGGTNYISQLFGIVSPWSYVPHLYMPYSARMSLWERLGNVFMSGTEDLLRRYSYYPGQDAVLQKHFSKLLDRVPTVKELESNISAVLLNGYMPLTSPRPLAYNMIPVGGLHTKPPKALPENLQEFLDEATHGAIYFSLGSIVRNTELPPAKLKLLLDVFGSLKQRVLWKFEDESLPNLPSNVMVKNWLPQIDILAHPNVKVFISHGGIFSLQEAVYSGVPVLGLPIFGDQYSNIKQAEAAGFALSLDYRELAAPELRHALIELLEKPKFRNNIKKASKVFRDRPMSAMDTAMYWIDYVIEHRGAPHLVSVGMELPWYQFYLLDVIGLGVTAALLAILAIFIICRKIFNLAKISSSRKIKKT